MRKLSFMLLLTILFVGCQSNAQKKSEKNAQNGKMAGVQPELAKNHTFPVQKSDAEWKKELTPEQYNILREAGTEPPHSSPLLHIKGKGVFVCAACENPLYLNKNQFVSGTGWPSFDQPIEGGVVLGSDTKLGYQRDEVVCARCGGHIGHRFNDGPKETTGLRYCMDGAAMNFIPADKMSVDQIIKKNQMTAKKMDDKKNK